MPGLLVSTLSFRKAVGIRSPDRIRRSHSDSALYCLYQMDTISNGVTRPYSTGSHGSSPTSPLARWHSYPCSPQSLSSSPLHSDDDDDGDDDDDDDDDDDVGEDSDEVRDYFVEVSDDEDEDYDGDDEDDGEVDDQPPSLLGQWRSPSPAPCILALRRDRIVQDLFHFTTETTRYLEPQTFCQVHHRFEFLRVDDIRFEEDYTRVVETRHGSSYRRVTHIFMDCILVFPSRGKLISWRRDDRPSTSAPPDPTLERPCGQCGVPVGGFYDPSFFRFDLFCSNECCYERTVDEQQCPEIGDREDDKGKAIMYIG